MPTFDSNGVQINFVDEGSGPPILLVHGFASSLEGNWRLTGVIEALVKDGRRVIALDNRGHGKSGKPHDVRAYGLEKMAGDSIALLDHLDLAAVDLMGYSMGGYISATLITQHPERFRTAIIGGAGERLLGSEFDELASVHIADALDSETGETDHPVARTFRMFAQASGGDLKALAAVMRSGRPRVDRAELAKVSIPVMVLSGESDPLVGDPKRLADAIPGAKNMTLPGDHISVFGGQGYRQAVLDFLHEHSPVTFA